MQPQRTMADRQPDLSPSGHGDPGPYRHEGFSPCVASPPMVHGHDDPYAAYYQSHMHGAPPYPPHPLAGRPPPPPPVALGAQPPHPGDHPPGPLPPLHHHHAIAAPPGPPTAYPPMQQQQHHHHHLLQPPPSSSSRDAPLDGYSSDYHHHQPHQHNQNHPQQHQHQQHQPHQPHQHAAASSSTPAMSSAPLPPPSAGSSGTQASPLMPKARSAMACQLCRRQKMKCEGPEKAPCRRCRAAQVECVFEAPPAAPPRPRGTGVNEAWVEGRLGQVEHRLELLEDTAAHSTSLVSGDGSAPPVSPQTVTDHERRLAALEAQLYNLQITMARQVQIPPQQHQSHSMYGPGPTSHAALEYPPQQPQSSHVYGSSNGAGGTHPYPSSYSHPSLASSAPASHARFDSPTVPKHEPDRSHSSASARTGGGGGSGSGSGTGGGAASSDAHREKRWKGELVGAGEGDFIARGLVSEEEAALCFDSYHLTFSSNGLEQPSDQNHLSFEETRRRSPLFLATVISIGARSLSRFDTFHTTYREAVRLAHDSFIPSAIGDDEVRDPLSTHRPGDSVLPAFARPGGYGLDDAHTNSILECRLPTLTLKALILLGLYHSMPELLVHSWMSGYRFIQPMVTQVFFSMTPEERNSPEARSLVNHTRVSLVAWLWLSFYTYTRGHHGAVWIGSDLLRRRLELIEQSVYAEATTDSVLRTNFEAVTIMLRMYEKISPGVKGSRASRELVFETVRDALAEIDEWNVSNFRMMETVTQWGDSADLKSIVPLHYFRLFILLYIFRDLSSDELDLADPQIEAWARMAAESAIVILRWGVESRIWMPFSVVGNYVHNVNVPAALWILGTLARLYPALIDFNSVRPILHRLAKQCTVTAASAGATYREIVRARKTKHEVEDLDRVAFELCEADASGHGAVSADGRTSRASVRDPSGGQGLAPGQGHWHGQASSASSTAGDDTPGLFGHEVTASLNSLRLELNLWAKPLRGFEDDD